MSLQLVIGRCVGRLGALVEAATEREGLKTPSDENWGFYCCGYISPTFCKVLSDRAPLEPCTEDDKGLYINNNRNLQPRRSGAPLLQRLRDGFEYSQTFTDREYARRNGQKWIG